VDLVSEPHVAARFQSPNPGWISRQKGFRKNDELGAGVGRLLNDRQRAFEARGPFK
jgi:hypothetical protein